MPRKWIRWLKVCFVLGAIIDGLAAVMLLSPPLTEQLLGIEVDASRADVSLLMGYGAALMAGWTVLLAWAAREPLGRAFVGPMTAVPVLAGLAATELVVLTGGGGNPVRVVPLLVLQFGWCVILLALYHAACRRRRPGGARG